MVSDRVASILWRRLDTAGHDACRLSRGDDGWWLGGVAAFVEGEARCGLAYSVACDAAWRARSARVTGAVGDDAIEIAIERAPGGAWRLNGVDQPGLDDLVDLDLGFTPATNLIALRRLALRVGDGAPAPAAYLAFPALRMERLEQTYRRLDDARYRYTAAAYAYDDVLVVSPDGFVTDYPGLWRSA